MLKQGLHQRMLQKLAPQQIQMIKLLELPSLELEQRILKELEENPVLEEGPEVTEGEEQEDPLPNEDESDEFTLDDYINEEDYPSYKLNANNHSKDDKKTEMIYSSGSTFHESLETQLGLLSHPQHAITLGIFIIGCLDDDGYLRRSITAIVDDLAFLQNVTTTEDELLDVLEIIQGLDPIGVGARDLQECLSLQIKNKIEKINHNISSTADDNKKNILLVKKEELKYAHQIIEKMFDEFTKKHYNKILSKLEIDDEYLKDIIDIIVHLNPRPGAAFSDSTKLVQHITPDFILESKNGELVLSLTSNNTPELRVSQTYSEMLNSYSISKGSKNKDKKEAISFVKQKLDSAKWFIDAVKQRQNTMLLTMNAIIEYQKEFFLDGEESKLKPMVLKIIAEKTGLDLSTISRVANSKYIQTHFGTYSLKYFFSEGMQTDSGEEVSTREIKNILHDVVNNENKQSPITDEKLSQILKEKGYPVARRTVAKYREQLSIPVARMRKEL